MKEAIQISMECLKRNQQRKQGNSKSNDLFFLDRSLCDIIRAHDFKYHLYLDDSKIHIYIPNFSTVCSASPPRCLQGFPNIIGSRFPCPLQTSTKSYLALVFSLSVRAIPSFQFLRPKFWSYSWLPSPSHIPKLAPSRNSC